MVQRVFPALSANRIGHPTAGDPVASRPNSLPRLRDEDERARIIVNRVATAKQEVTLVLLISNFSGFWVLHYVTSRSATKS